MSNFTSFLKLFNINFRNLQAIEIECNSKNLTFCKGDALQHEGRAVLAYLRHKKIEDNGRFTPPVVHLTCCNKIQESPNKYFCTSVDKSSIGEFWVDAIDNKRDVVKEHSGPRKLKACQFCLSALYSIPFTDELYLNSEQSNKEKLKALTVNFDFNEFLNSDYLLNPRIWHSSDHTNISSGEWKSLSEEIRKKAKWICDSCKISFEHENLRPFLHTHHINLNSTFNHEVNLRPLCIECHAEQPNHGHMKENNHQYKLFMERKHSLLKNYKTVNTQS